MTTHYTLGARGPESTINRMRDFLTSKLRWQEQRGIKECLLSIPTPGAVCELAWDWSGDAPIRVEPEPNGLCILSFSGEAAGTPLGVLEQASRQWPEIEWWLSATTEQEDHEYWTAKNGCLTPVNVYSRWLREGVVITFVRGGEHFVPPEFDGDMVDERGDPIPIMPEQLVESCQGLYRGFFGVEYPGDIDTLVKAATTFIDSHIQERQ
jgi:hypothetical protein